MSTVPPSGPDPALEDAPLNPALKQVRDKTYGPDQEGSDPMASVSVKKDEGSYWPAIWAAVTIVCVIVAVVLIVL
ncbi:MAG: hypothetical protein AB7S92_19355 [Parvibaculaceae bacterium]